MSQINFESELIKIGNVNLINIPLDSSKKLPSRGMTLVNATINNYEFTAALEPDGNKSHWIRVDNKLQEATNLKVGNKVKVSIEPSKDWPEPNIPKDLSEALKKDNQARELWDKITPMARWDWIRWIGSTKQAETRKRRIEVACSKLRQGDRRPCCFNRTVCTDPTVSKNGVLIGIN